MGTWWITLSLVVKYHPLSSTVYARYIILQLSKLNVLFINLLSLKKAPWAFHCLRTSEMASVHFFPPRRNQSRDLLSKNNPSPQGVQGPALNLRHVVDTGETKYLLVFLESLTELLQCFATLRTFKLNGESKLDCQVVNQSAAYRHHERPRDLPYYSRCPWVPIIKSTEEP